MLAQFGGYKKQEWNVQRQGGSFPDCAVGKSMATQTVRRQPWQPPVQNLVPYLDAGLDLGNSTGKSLKHHIAGFLKYVI